jgi:hypothetical protein
MVAKSAKVLTIENMTIKEKKKTFTRPFESNTSVNHYWLSYHEKNHKAI